LEIEYLVNYTDRSGKVHLAGEHDHCSNAVAELYFHEKIAKRPAYKTFKEAMDAKEKERAATQQTPDPNAVKGVEWGVMEHGNSGRVTICRKTLLETLYGNDKSFPDVPKSILVRYFALLNQPLPQSRESLYQEQQRADARDYIQRGLARGIVATGGGNVGNK